MRIFLGISFRWTKTYKVIFKSELVPLTPDGILVKQNRIVIPNDLQHRVIELAHENHLGIAKTIALLREKFISLIWQQRWKQNY